MNDQALEVARTMAIHTAAMKPGYLNIEDVDEKAIKETLEEAEATAQKSLKEGMPEHVANKVILGVKNKALSQMHKRDVLM
jgi:translation elongation factor EF-Ts